MGVKICKSLNLWICGPLNPLNATGAVLRLLLEGILKVGNITSGECIWPSEGILRAREAEYGHMLLLQPSGCPPVRFGGKTVGFPGRVAIVDS